MNVILLIWVCRSCHGSCGVNYVRQSRGNNFPAEVWLSHTQWPLLVVSYCSEHILLFYLCRQYLCLMFLNVEFNVLKDIQRRGRCLLQSAFNHDAKLQRSKVMKPIVHMVHTVFHLFICVKTLLLLTKWLWLCLDCVKSRQTRMSPDHSLFILVSGSRR